MRLPFSTKKEINDWAKRYTSAQTDAQKLVEQYLMSLKKTVRDRRTQRNPCGYLSYNELYDLVYWKLKRSRWIDKNTEIYVRKVTREAFLLDDDWEKLKKLADLHGVGQSVASAILHLCDEKRYPILDKHALSAIGLDDDDIHGPRYPFWQEYVDFCRLESKRYNVLMRTLDRALYAYSAVDLRENKALRLRRYPPGGKLGVTIDGKKQIRCGTAADTLVEVIERVGIELVEMIGLWSNGIPLVGTICYPDVRHQRKVGNYYIALNTATLTKAEQLKDIDCQLDVDLIVDLME